MLLLSRLQRMFMTYGLIGSLRRIFSQIPIVIYDVFDLNKRQLINKRRRADEDFDFQWNLNTCGVLHLSASAVRGKNWLYGNRYQAIDPLTFLDIVRNLAIAYERFVFIDIGSGKGRAVLLATEFPFKRIVGVEYSPELDIIAKDNLTRFPKELQRCKNIDLICTDAADFKFPKDPMVVFMYNPFGTSVMKRVINNLTDSFLEKKREIVIVYYSAECSALWDRVDFLQRISVFPAIYRNRDFHFCAAQ